MNADVPPIAADKGLMDCVVANCDVVEPLPDAIDQDLIGGNRRGIGENRRFPH
jgi:hypothetical protein